MNELPESLYDYMRPNTMKKSGVPVARAFHGVHTDGRPRNVELRRSSPERDVYANVAQQGKAALFFHAISRAEQATNAPVERCGNFSNFTRLEIFRHCCGSVISGSRLPGRVSKHALDDFHSVQSADVACASSTHRSCAMTHSLVQYGVFRVCERCVSTRTDLVRRVELHSLSGLWRPS